MLYFSLEFSEWARQDSGVFRRNKNEERRTPRIERESERAVQQLGGGKSFPARGPRKQLLQQEETEKRNEQDGDENHKVHPTGQWIGESQEHGLATGVRKQLGEASSREKRSGVEKSKNKTQRRFGRAPKYHTRSQPLEKRTFLCSARSDEANGWTGKFKALVRRVFGTQKTSEYFTRRKQKSPQEVEDVQNQNAGTGNRGKSKSTGPDTKI